MVRPPTPASPLPRNLYIIRQDADHCEFMGKEQSIKGDSILAYIGQPTMVGRYVLQEEALMVARRNGDVVPYKKKLRSLGRKSHWKCAHCGHPISRRFSSGVPKRCPTCKCRDIRHVKDDPTKKAAKP